ncbi:Protein scabrous [Habropoda laboriosa]|uniref:Protein scabrous n=1 Tax=Habropoda laboriosa TaxID=597456 RepID=A0A0L7QSL1_9HYME|nr:PREDICTED: protein scabrous-like [Habropoda laboriosa]KOC61456.1 Protein scabrous [Habropoda laboriosa]
MDNGRSGAWLLLCCATFAAIVAQEEIRGEENVTDAIRSLREQVNALLDHRQQDYNALEGSLKRAIEKNTELFVLKNEIKQLRKEVISLRGGNGNEAKNERLRVRWLGSAVTELQGEVAEVLRTRNASEELAERSRMKGELALLKGDVAAVGRGIRNLGGRIAKIEAVLGTIRVDIAAVKERFTLLSRSCADVASQLSSVQIEVKSLRCETSSAIAANSVFHRGIEGDGVPTDSNKGSGDRKSTEHDVLRRGGGEGGARRHGYYARRNEGHRTRFVEDRLKSLERKISLSTQRRASLEKRVAAAAAAAAAYENEEWSSLSRRMNKLERAQVELSRQMSNVSESTTLTRKIGESVSSRVIGSLRSLEEAIERNNSSTKREMLRLDVNAARKAAELSLTREELNNLRRTVQALSVSASKLQERSDRQQEAIDLFNVTTTYYAPPTDFHQLSYPELSSAALFSELEQLEDRYHTIGNNLTGDCELPEKDGLRLLEAGARPILVFCRQGWTVVARRIDGTLDFDRTWNDYSLGFGSPVTEYWIGNQILHKLTRDNCTRLRIDMVDIYAERWRAEYDWFAVESEETGYTLRVGGYAGNATDALSYQNGMAFSAKDRDMDVSTTHCARNYHGGWWFSRCQHANLNGKYSLGLTWFRSDTNRWMSIASSEMSVRTNSNCRSR